MSQSERVNLINATDSDVNIAEAHFAQAKSQQCAGLGFLRDLQTFTAILTLLHLQRLLYIRGTHIYGGGAILVGIDFLLAMTVVVLLASLFPRLLNPHLRLHGGDIESLLFLLVVALFPLIVHIASVTFANCAVAVIGQSRVFTRMRVLARLLELFLILLRVGAGLCSHVTLQQIMVV